MIFSSPTEHVQSADATDEYGDTDFPVLFHQTLQAIYSLNQQVFLVFRPVSSPPSGNDIKSTNFQIQISNETA